MTAIIVAFWIISGCCFFACTVYALGMAAARSHLRKRQGAPSVLGTQLPGLSVLKPIKGCEEDLERNLASFFRQRYPGPFEIIFSAGSPDDPGIETAHRVAKRFRQVPVRFVQSDPLFSLNPKVANLAAALRHARHDLVLQSDANVTVGEAYAEHMVRELLDEGASLSSSMIAGIGERSVGAAMENLHLTSFIGPGNVLRLSIWEPHLCDRQVDAVLQERAQRHGGTASRS